MSILKDSFIQYIIKFLKPKIEAKQDNLVSGTNIKTINGTSLLGSGDVVVSGDASGSVDEGRLVWSQETILDNTTILDAIMRDTIGNKIAFMNRGGIQIEYSRDNGGTWVDYGADNVTKTQLVTPIVGFAQLALGGRYPNDATALTDRLRVTLDAIEGDFYFRINKILIQVENGVNSLAKFMVDIEYKTYGGSDWIAYKTSQLVGSPGWSSIPVSNLPAWGYKSNPNIRYIRFTFRQEVFIQYKGRLRNIAIIGLKNTTGGNNLTNKGTIYSLDVYQNATFPNAIKGKKLITDGGKSTQVVLGDGSLRPISELSPITDADAEILLDNHIHSIDVNANGNNVNISVIESSKNGNNWETEDNDIPIPLATTTSAGVMSKEDKTSLDNLINDGHIYPTNYLANWDGNSSIEIDDGLQIQLDNITSYNSNTEGLIFTVNIQTPSQHDGEDYIYLSLYDSDENELAYIEHLITDDDCYNGSTQLELKCPLVAITSGYIDLYNSTNEPINIANPTLKRYEVKNVRDISDKLLVKLGDINTILESIINN